MPNASLDDFAGRGDGGEERPAAEAVAVAGDGSGAVDFVDTADYRFPDADGTVELAVTQVDYTIEGRGPDERPVLHVFGRDGDRAVEHVRVHGFRPYFYAPLADFDGVDDPAEPVTEADLADPRLETDGLTGVETYADRRADGADVGADRDDERVVVYESIRGRRLAKVFGRTPRDVGQARDEFDHYEADILFPNRLLIDKDVRSGVRVPDRRADDGAVDVPHQELEPVEMDVAPRVNTFDIEVDDRSGFPEDGEEEIVCLSAHDSYRDEYVVWLSEPPSDAVAPDGLADHDPLDPEATHEVRSFEREEAMLADFLDYIRETDPCILTGWNFTDFDAPYLLDRLEVLGGEGDLDPDRLSRVDEVWRSDWQGPNVKGRVVFDLLYAYQRTQFTELDSYRLDDVGEEELGAGKERYPGDVGDLWEDDPERLLEYNLRDVELCVELDRKQEIVAFWNDARKLVGCKIEDAPTPGDAVDMYVLHEAHGRFALPSKGQQESEDFEGGAVFEPISGVREMLSVLDLKSLYPMSMVTINASPETIVDPDEYDGETYRTPSGIHFRKDQDGIIREMVDALLSEREDLKDRRDAADPGSTDYERYDRQQSAVKVIMNCFTPDTEVLTPAGVRNIRDLDVGDEVYSLDPETERMEVKPVVETHEYPDYRGELVDIETSRIDFRVTPNHRMLVRKNDKNGITEDNWGFVEADDLHEYCHYEMPHGWSFDHADALDDTIDLVTLSTDVTDTPLAISDGGSKFAAKFGTPNIPREINTDVFLRFLAWYITEGSVYRADNGNHRIRIAQEDAETRGQIESLVDEFTEYYYENGRSIEFSSRVWADLLETLCGDSSGHKRIPDIVFEASEAQKRDFLNILIKGDGDRQTNSWRYSTISDRLKDDLLRLCTHLGITASVNRDENTWRIYATENGKNSFRMYRSGESSSAENGVFCVSIKDNNTLLAGRNGKYNFVGNSLYGVFGWDRFRLYDREMSAAITATNREVISYTEEVANEMDYQVTYGDSVTGDRPVVVRDSEGRVRIESIEALFERATSGTEATVLAADGGVTTTNSGKERASLDGWEALSVNGDGDAEWRPIRRVIRHETDAPVVNLQHTLGESTTTHDHSYVVDDGDELVEAVPEDVTEPMRVPGLPEVDTVDRIDVYEVLDGYTRAYEDGRSRGSENAETKVNRVHANDEYVWFGHSHHDALDSTVKVQRYVERGTEAFDGLVRLLAAYVTEGSATTAETATSKFGASIAESRREWLEGLQDDYHRLFDNVETSVIRSDSGSQRRVDYETDEGTSSVTYDDATLKLQMMNELSAVFFREFAGQRSRGKRIPSFVFHLPEREQRLFIDVLVEGDGSRAFPRYTEACAERNFDFETVSRELAAGLSTLLTQRGENHSLKYRDEKESYTIRTCDYYREGRDPVLTEVEHDGHVYDLDVAENDNFVDAVGGIVLHNTDSVMLEVGDDLSKEEAIDRSFELARRINQSYDDFARERLNAEAHRFEIEFEKLYRRFFQAGKKKRYAGHVVWKEGNDVDDIDIVGFEYQRSDIAPITKEVQREVLERIVRSEDEYRESVKEYVHDIVERFQNGEMSVEEVGIPGGIGKRLDNYDTDTAQVRGAKYANLLLGTNFGRGSKPKRLYLKRVHNDFYDRVEREHGLDIQEDPLYREFRENEDVICVEYADQLPEEFEVDWEKMLDRTLRGPIERVLSAIDISWDEVKTGQEQTGLGSFM